MATYRNDNVIPHLTGKTEEDIIALSNALVELDSQLRYVLGHLGLENFSEGALNELKSYVKGDDL